MITKTKNGFAATEFLCINLNFTLVSVKLIKEGKGAINRNKFKKDERAANASLLIKTIHKTINWKSSESITGGNGAILTRYCFIKRPFPSRTDGQTRVLNTYSAEGVPGQHNDRTDSSLLAVYWRRICACYSNDVFVMIKRKCRFYFYKNIMLL
jgi:hypothetical protein